MEKNVQDKEYFSLNNLTALSRIDEHLSFVEEIMEKYNEKNFIWEDVHQQIDFIRKKKNDKKLNISVIGEFSTGKSTFINALIRKELLASSAMQGTTVASTVIDYAGQCNMRLEYLDGHSEMLNFSCFDELRSGLKYYTTEASVARQLKAVNVSLPADILKNEFRIIDTPGTNVTEAWHEDVTVRALKEKSDLSIILTSAEKPVPNTMLSFARKNLESILPQCVFVVTKLDSIRPRERDRQLAYVKMKLEEELDIQEAVVLPYVSPMVLGSQMPMDDKYPVMKKKVCIIGSFGSGKRDLAQVLLNGKISDIFRERFLQLIAPILKLVYATELVVKIRFNEPIKLDSGFYKCCPSRLKYFFKKYNGVNLPEIEVEYTDLCDLLKKLERLAETDSECQNVFSVASIGLPLERLKNEYEITLCWFQELYSDLVARDELRRAMDEATDIIMLLNAAHLWNSDEKNFVRHCRGLYDTKFIFAVDNMDKLVKADIPRIKDYCRNQINSFNMPDAPICYISTASEETGISSLTEELAKNGVRDGADFEQVAVDDVLLGMSLETEQKLVQHTANQRTLAVTKKLMQLIDDTYQSVSGQMEQISKDYENRLELLDRSRKADLSMFIRQEKLERLQCFDVAARDVSRRFEVRAGFGDKRCSSIMGYIDKCSDTELKEYLDTSMNRECGDYARELIAMMNESCEKIRYIFKKEMASFYDSFQQLYRSLDIIPLDLSEAKYHFPKMDGIGDTDIASTADYIVSQLDNMIKWQTKFILGVMGGGFWGIVGAPLIGPIMIQRQIQARQKARQACRDKLKPQLTNYYNGVSEKVVSAVNQYIRKMRNCLSDEIDEYLKRYRSEVDRQIAIENSRRSDINRQLGDLKADMTSIQNHKKQLDSVVAQLNNFGRKE